MWCIIDNQISTVLFTIPSPFPDFILFIRSQYRDASSVRVGGNVIPVKFALRVFLSDIKITTVYMPMLFLHGLIGACIEMVVPLPFSRCRRGRVASYEQTLNSSCVLETAQISNTISHQLLISLYLSLFLICLEWRLFFYEDMWFWMGKRFIFSSIFLLKNHKRTKNCKVVWCRVYTHTIFVYDNDINTNEQ